MLRTLIVAVLRLAAAAILLVLLLALWQLHADDSVANNFAKPAMTVFVLAIILVVVGFFALVPRLVGWIPGLRAGLADRGTGRPISRRDDP